MSELIEVKIDESKLKRIQRIFAAMPREIPRVIVTAINRTAGPAKTQISREIRNNINASAKRVNERVILKKATRAQWAATIHISGRRLPIAAFGAKVQEGERWVVKPGQDFASPETGPIGISYKIKKQGKRQVIKHAFFATVTNVSKAGETSEHAGVFKRKAKARLPIIELFGPSIGMVLENADWIVKKVTADAYTNLEKNIDAQIKYMMEWKKVG